MFTLGLDGLDITINTDVKLEQNHYTFKNQAWKELGNLAAVKNGYKLHLCLPKMIRNNNSIPFGVSDYKQLKNVLEFIKNNVLNLFKGESTEITVQACEVNSTVVLSRKEQTAPMLKLLSHVLLIKDEKLFIACSGEQIGKRYKAVKNLCSGQRIESIKTGQLSNLRFCFKIYDKAIEQNITDKGLFFKPSYKEIIAEAMKSDAQKTYERNSQPVIEEKNRAIGKTYMSNFLLRKALSMANTAVSSDEVASNE